MDMREVVSASIADVAVTTVSEKNEKKKSIVPDYEITLNPGKWSRKKRDINPSIIARVFRECNYSCVVCGLVTLHNLPRDKNGRIQAFRRTVSGKLVATKETLTIDHLVPKALRSANHYPNLIVLCGYCNNLKADKLPRDWLKTLKVELQRLLLDKVIFAEIYHVLVSEPNAQESALMAQGISFQKGRNKNFFPLWSLSQ